MYTEDLEGELLPLQGSTEWGNGKVLVTTNNAGVIPQTTTVSTVTLDPLSIEESANLVGKLARYSLSESEKESLKSTVKNKHWRCLPLEMAM